VGTSRILNATCPMVVPLLGGSGRKLWSSRGWISQPRPACVGWERKMDFSSLPKYRGLRDDGHSTGDRDNATRWYENGPTVAILVLLALVVLLLILGWLLLGPLLFFVPQLA